MLIRNMEKNVSAFVVDPKRDFIRKSELSFSKTMRFILGMGILATLMTGLWTVRKIIFA